MFSASGSKKVMFENLKKSKSSGKPIHEIASPVVVTGPRASMLVRTPPATPSTPTRSKSVVSSFSDTQEASKAKIRITSESIESDLKRTDNHGTSVRKIAKAIASFRIDRDGALLDAFRTKSINYNDFRMLLKRIFAINFTDDEFDYICEIFDVNQDKSIDGPAFLVAMRLLGSEWKAQEARTSRKREELSEQAQKEREEREKAEKEAILENACDPFTEEDRNTAIEKVTIAATKYSKTDPTAPSLQAFEVKYLKPFAFKVLLKNTFAVVVNRRELGALVEMFDTEGYGLVDSGAFLLKFIKLGLEHRDLKRKKQIEMIAKAERDAIEYQESLLRNVHDNREAIIDPNFEEEDQMTALAKIKKAAKGYRKHGGVGNVALDGFNSVTITPGLFREMLKRTFNVLLTGKELGAVTKYFCKDDSGDIHCQTFLVHFTKVGTEERGKERVLSLQKQWGEIEEKKKKEQDKLEAASKKNLLDPTALNQYTEADLNSATEKFREAAKHFTMNICEMPGSLDAFNVASMLPGVFQEKCLRILHVSLTNNELGAIVAKFDYTGDKSEVDCPAFAKFLKRLGFEEKEKLWKKEKQMRDMAKSQKASRMAQVKEDFQKTVEIGAIDFNFTQADYKSGIEKLRYAASHVESVGGGNSAIVLNAFNGISMTPGQLREKLKSAMGLRLTSKELGAIFKPFALPDGQIVCEEIVNLILSLSKEVREELRQKRIAAEKLEKEKIIAERNKVIAEKLKVECEILKYDHTHESSLLTSLNSAAQNFALDNASYLRSMEPLKAPSISPNSFIDIFFRIFQIKLTYPEVGILMKIVNPSAAAHRLVDGINFLKGFYKLSRLQNQVLLGKLNPDHIHLHVLRPDTPTLHILKAGTTPVDAHRKHKSHWTANDLEQETKKDEKLHKSNPLPPMLPMLCEGENPWDSLGPKKYSLFSSSRPVSANRPRTPRSRSPPMDSARSSRSPSPNIRANSPSSLHSPSRATSPMDDRLPSRSNSPPLIDISIISKRPGSAPAAMVPYSDKRSISEKKISLPKHVPPAKVKDSFIIDADFAVDRESLDLVSKLYGAKLVRTSLPATFSPAGLARQYERKLQQSTDLDPLKRQLFVKRTNT